MWTGLSTPNFSRKQLQSKVKGACVRFWRKLTHFATIVLAWSRANLSKNTQKSHSHQTEPTIPEVLYDFYIYVQGTHHAPTFFTGNPTRTSRGVHILIFSDFDRAEKILSNLQKSSNFVIFDHFSTLSNNLHSLKRSKSFRIVCD